MRTNMGHINKIRRYFFSQKRSLRSKLPLTPRRPTSKYSPWGDPPASLRADIVKLKYYGLANTDADAYRLIKKHPGKTITRIIELESPKRRFWSWTQLFWHRFKRVW
jgi:hypothetical protein